MKNELLDLDHLITVVLNPANLTAKNLDEAFLKENKLFAEKEMERIRQKLLAVSIKPGAKRCIELYYQQQQAKLIGLTDKVFCYLQTTGPESIYRLTTDISVIQFYGAIALVPETLLLFIENTFPSHFDQNMKIPDARRAIEKSGISRCLQQIKNELKEIKIHEELFWIICTPFEDFLSPDKNITYRELGYLLAFQRRVNNYLSGNDKIHGSEQLCELLIYLNNNSLRFLNYYTMMHKENERNIHTIPDLILYYHLQMKRINQLPVKPGISYKAVLPLMKDQICSWIYNEIIYYEKQWQIKCNSHIAENTKDDKIKTRLSVAELALAMKLLLDSKLIISNNSTELLSLVVNNIRTDRIEHISKGSLRNKYYNVERSTVDSMKSVIRDLMNLMREY